MKDKPKKFQKILIANRGEIACRVIQTVQEMGMQAVSIYSDADKFAKHAVLANESYHLPGNKPAETYLDIPKILEIAKAANVDAIHPGYGFLSENADFAAACQKAKIVFIGPSPEVIDKMGDKLHAKAMMDKAGVPTVPGLTLDAEFDLESGFANIEKAAEKIGYPILVKAAAGGGGKGMRLVEKNSELKGALEAAAREAQNAFGDARVFLEKYIGRPRHIEFQILGDAHGNIVHLFERECSIQRRYQKIIEESPSPALTPELRKKMGDAAVKAAQAMGYTNAGTVEFIASGNDFYFLEVNTRLQVEHPITELVTRKDLVRLQIDIAQGEPLPFRQEDLSQDGHAIECRIYAEDPANNFMPSVGPMRIYKPPQGSGIRVDDGYTEGYEVTVHYDPMLAKLICWGSDRQAAIERMRWALSQYVILGFNHNISFLRQIMTHPAFQAGDLHTHFLAENKITPELTSETSSSVTPYLEAIIDGLSKPSAHRQQSVKDITQSEEASPWLELSGWRGA
ncbi:MAG: acetyl-CoA carboxylase biotin carboxylase subunit [Vampirovibrionales bacterium]|nr:acetyl-CoA carboxylase biotin carboxylase subunit [Vampirovibrionales bacterium]